MKAARRSRSLLPIALLLIASSCENHPIPNSKEKSGNVPAETYESGPFAGEIDANPDAAAEFPGGKRAMIRWLAENIRYPQTAVEQGIEGRVYLQFVVDRNGSVRNVRVVRGVDPALDREAVRAVKSMPRWIPGKNNKKSVNSTFNLPINFKLE